mmetsp:Transcript_38247/g.95955  ORF Transcript_38247/g.95955 Transcript_38247/m.95955 type:complete len:228 (+) Transcript_38247:178-861(+)
MVSLELARNTQARRDKLTSIQRLDGAVVLGEASLKGIDHGLSHWNRFLAHVPMDFLSARRCGQGASVMVEAPSVFVCERIQIKRISDSGDGVLTWKLRTEPQLLHELQLRRSCGAALLVQDDAHNGEAVGARGPLLLVHNMQLTSGKLAIHLVLCREVKMELLYFVIPIRQLEGAKASVHLHVLGRVVENLHTLERCIREAARQRILGGRRHDRSLEVDRRLLLASA